MAGTVSRSLTGVVVSLVFSVGTIDKPKYKTMSVGPLDFRNYFPDLPSLDGNETEMGLIRDVCDALDEVTSLSMIHAREVITSNVVVGG